MVLANAFIFVQFMNFHYRVITKVIKDEPEITIESETIISVKTENIEHYLISEADSE